MRILVLGVYYASNLGDAVICDCVADRLMRAFPGAQIDLKDVKNRHAFRFPAGADIKRLGRERKREALRHFVTRYAFWDKEYKHERCRLDGSRDYIDELCREDYDLVVFAGGQLFQDGFSLFLEHFVERLSARNTPVIFNACGVGPSWSKKVRAGLSRALTAPNVHWVSTRDDAPFIERVYLKNTCRAIPVSDPALWADQVYGIRRDEGTSKVGLGMMYATSVDLGTETKFWIETIRDLEKKGVSWEVFINGAPMDRTYARFVLGQIPELKKPADSYLAPAPESPRALVQTIARYKSLISFRLHSHIIATSLGIPGIAIVWDEKLRFFYGKLGRPERCMTVKDKPETVWQALCRAEAEGVDRSLVEKSRQDSLALLTEEVSAILRENEEMTAYGSN